jgi:hypothetical protein
MVITMYIQFPIVDPFRFPLLIMEWIFIISSFEIGLIFLFKYFKQPRQLKNSQDLGLSMLFYGFSFMRFFFLISSFYASNNIVSPFLLWSYGSYRTLYLNFGILSITIGIFLCTFFIEKNKKFIFRKYFFTIYYSIILIIFFLFFFLNLEYVYSFSALSWPFFIPSLVIYLIDFGKVTEKQRILKGGFIKMIITLTLIFIGHILSLDIIVDRIGLSFRVIGIILHLIAIGLIFIFFRRVPPFFEFEWENKIEDIYILNKDGICLYNHSFINSKNDLDNQIITGSLTSMNILLEEIMFSHNTEISVVEKKGKIITIFSGSYITGILISKEKLQFFRHNLKKLILKIEGIYKNVLTNWDGDLAIFLPIKNIINEIFVIDS